MKKLSVTLLLIAVLSVAQAQEPAFTDVSQHIPAAIGAQRTMDIQVVDINGDGYPDLVLAIEWDRNRILINDGEGRFSDGSAGVTSPAANDSEDIAVADFNDDGLPDLVFVSEDNRRHEYYINLGAGRFEDRSHLLPMSEANAVVSPDLNLDGIPDLILGNNGRNTILINNGDGSFRDETVLRYPLLAETTQDLLMVDVDGDGDPDMIEGNEGRSRILINDGTGVFTDETDSRFPSGLNMETRKVIQADFNGDGWPDLFFCNVQFIPTKDPRDRLFINQGGGYFRDETTDRLPLEWRSTLDAVVVDLDGDPYPDLVLTHYPNSRAAAYLNGPDGVLRDATAAYLPTTAAGSGIAVIAADLNGDGLTDLYFGNFGPSDKLLLRKPMSTGSDQAARTAAGWRLSPNPACDRVTVSIPESPWPGGELILYDTAGQMVLRHRVPAGVEETMSFAVAEGPKRLPSGDYVAVLRSATGNSYSALLQILC